MAITPKSTVVDHPQSPFFSLLADADSIQVREVSKSSQPSIVRSVDEAVQNFDRAEEHSSNSETRSFLVTVKKPTAKTPSAAKPAPSFQRDHASVLRQASLLMNSGDYLLARNLYSYVLKGNIRDEEALKGLGICLLHLLDILSAKKCFNALFELYGSPQGAALMGICYTHEQNDKAAQEHFNKVNDPKQLPIPLRFDYFKEYGNCLTRLGRLNEASVSYRCALELNPNSDAVYVNLGTLEMQRHQFESAANNFQRAIELSPRNSKAYCGIGLLAQISGEKIVAETYFEKSLDFDPQNSVSLLQLIALAKIHTDWQRVKLRLVKLLLKEPNNLEMRFLLATALFKENDWMHCEKELDFILLKNPTHERAQRLRNELTLQKHA